ncbi:hypothetical protein [Pseudoprimorskyibacter insulae]|uniref:hypothetical protein n=1 Tax=Pseudoprimorskyibacter insulae TaxID=1695997 RepID=UPI002481B6AB|nr:hypothetical protein [Pseudoprimorskyibacter insulae]
MSLAVIVPAQFIVTYVPLAQKVMGTAAVSLADGVIKLGICVVFFATIEIEKQIRLTVRRGNRR